MNKVFIYYSKDGSGDVVAEKLKEHGVEIRKIETKQPLPKSFFWSMMVGGFKGLTKYKDKLYDYDKDISKYEEVIIGSPIWFDRISAPINRVLDDLDLNDKKVSFIFYSGSGEANKAEERVKDMFDEYPSIAILKEPKNNKKELNKIRLYE